MNARKVKKSAYPAAVPYEPDLLGRLRDPNYAAGYLSECLQSGGDPDEELDVFFAAIEKLVKSQGASSIAEEMHMTRDALYKILDGHKNPKMHTLIKLLNVLKLELSISPQGNVARRHSKRTE